MALDAVIRTLSEATLGSQYNEAESLLDAVESMAQFGRRELDRFKRERKLEGTRMAMAAKAAEEKRKEREKAAAGGKSSSAATSEKLNIPEVKLGPKGEPGRTPGLSEVIGAFGAGGAASGGRGAKAAGGITSQPSMNVAGRQYEASPTRRTVQTVQRGPVVTNVGTKRALYIPLKQPTTRVVTDQQQNLSPADILRAQMRREAVGSRERIAKQEQLAERLSEEAEILGISILQSQSGELAPGELSTRVQGLLQRYGPQTTARILSGARREAERLGFERYKDDLASKRIERRGAISSRRIEERQEAAENRRQEDPTYQVRRREANILLKISEGKKISEEERRFLDERARLDPIRAAVRDAFRGTSLGPRKPTQQDLDEQAILYEQENGEPPPSPNALRQYMEHKGFEFQ